MDRPSRIRSIEELFDPVDVRAFASQASAALIDELHSDERLALEPMSQNRRAEFATARVCAGLALAEYGVSGPVLRNEAGDPLWPGRARGSISHTRGFCVAVATLADHSIGLDVEEVDRMSPAVERRILVDAERAILGDLDDERERHRFVATVFAAKEAFYKAHFALDRRYLGFDAVHVSVHGTNVTFGPASGAVEPRLLDRTTGRCGFDDQRVIVGVTIHPAPGAGVAARP